MSSATSEVRALSGSYRLVVISEFSLRVNRTGFAGESWWVIRDIKLLKQNGLWHSWNVFPALGMWHSSEFWEKEAVTVWISTETVILYRLEAKIVCYFGEQDSFLPAKRFHLVPLCFAFICVNETAITKTPYISNALSSKGNEILWSSSWTSSCSCLWEST